MGVSIAKVVSNGGDAKELVALHVNLTDEDWDGFNAMEFEVSRGLSTGPFDTLTAPTWTRARVPEDAGPPGTPPSSPVVDIIGRTLKLQVDGNDISYTFLDPGGGTITVEQAVAQLGSFSGQFIAWITDGAQAVLETVSVGTASSLRVYSSEAASALQLPIGLYTGKNGRPVHILGKERYVFYDTLGSSEYFYRMRFVNTVTGAHSSYTQPYPGSMPRGVTTLNLITGKLKLAGVDGRPVPDRMVLVQMNHTLDGSDGFLLTEDPITKTTDRFGEVEFLLVRGAKVTVTIVGTDIVRDIEVPTDPAIGVFNLLDPSIGPDDYWKAQQPTIKWAQRRSL